MGKINLREINNFSLLITKLGLIPKLTIGTLLAKIFPSLSKILDLKFSFLNVCLISGISFMLNNITLNEKIIAKIKKMKKINAILSKDIFRYDLFSVNEKLSLYL